MKDSPYRLSWREWLRALADLRVEVRDDNVSVVAASLAFYGILAMFPALIALVSVYGLLLDPADVERQMSQLAAILPPSAARLVNDQLHEIVSGADGSLQLGVVLSLIGLIWTTSSGVGALLKGINLAYFEDETRGFLRLRALALATTLAAIVFAVVALAFVAVIPPVLASLGAPPWMETLIAWLRWPVLAVVSITGLALLYRYAPNHPAKPPFRWITPGSLAATGIWLLGSAAFSFYVTHFGNYNETYGALGAVIVLLLWMWLGAFAILLGAELNAVLEARSRRPRAEARPAGLGGHAPAH